ncbi:MAG TPA: Crp/Fnr family transcriptional regulator [Anaerolineae bacterium]|nr:Crp/Fnr family transcriptional regulator [Anaerolineae bacterium]
MTQMDHIQLRKVALFAALSARTLERVAAVARPQHVLAETQILLAGDPCTTVYFVVAGTVRVYQLSAEGREQVLAHLEPGQALNLVPALLEMEEARNLSSVAALTDVTLYAIPRADFLHLLERCPELTMTALRHLAARVAHLTELVADLSLRTVRARLARFMLEQCSAESPAPWTHAEIAARIGSVRVVVSRTLRDFAAEGILEVQRQRITVADREALIREAAL